MMQRTRECTSPYVLGRDKLARGVARLARVVGFGNGHAIPRKAMECSLVYSPQSVRPLASANAAYYGFRAVRLVSIRPFSSFAVLGV